MQMAASRVVMAIALEAVVKLLALIAVGIFVVWGISGGISNVINEMTLRQLDTGMLIIRGG